MAEIGSLGIFRGYADSGGDAEYGAFYVYFGYTVSGTTISNMKVYLRKTVQYKYTTNSAYIDSVAVNGQIFSVSPTSAALGSYNTANAGPTFTVSGSYYASSSSATVTIRMHRNAQSANAQTFTGTIYGLATAPTGVWCSLNSIGATEASLSGGYSSNGGASVTSTGYQYSTNNSSWSNCSSSPSGLSTGQKYYFRYYATNSVGTTYSSSVSGTTSSWPTPTNPKPTIIAGKSFTINFSNPSRLNVNVYIKIVGGTEKKLGSSTGTSVSGGGNSEWQEFFLSAIPKSRSGTYQINLYVTDGGNYNEYFDGGTFTINNDEVPTFEASYITNVKDTLHTDITGDYNKIIRNHNTITGTIKPMTSKYWATPKQYTVINGNKNTVVSHTGSNVTFTLQNVDSAILTVTASDYRDLSTSRNVSLNIVPYVPPSIPNNAVTLTREQGTGLYVHVNITGEYFRFEPYNFAKNNTVTSIKYRYKKETASSWEISWTEFKNKSVSNGQWKVVDETLSKEFVNDSRYNFEIQVTDLLETVTFTGYMISTASALIWRDLKNQRIGIGRKPEHNLDVEGDIAATSAIYLNGKKLLWYE